MNTESTFDESMPRLIPADAAADGRDPLGSVLLEQLSFAAAQFRVFRSICRRARQLALHADEISLRIAALLQPVGIDQPRDKIIRAGDDFSDEGKLLVGHQGLPSVKDEK